jgi:hypothetical protein
MLVIHTPDHCRANICISILKKYILLPHIHSMRKYVMVKKYTHVEFSTDIYVFSTTEYKNVVCVCVRVCVCT